MRPLSCWRPLHVHLRCCCSAKRCCCSAAAPEACSGLRSPLPDTSDSAAPCVQTATAGVQAFVRLGSAAFVASNLANFRKRPQKPIELYEYEGGRSCVQSFSAASKARWAARKVSGALFSLPPAASHPQAWRSVHSCMHSALACHIHLDELMPSGPAPGWPVPKSRIVLVCGSCTCKHPTCVLICRLPLLSESARSLHPPGERSV